MSNVYHVPGILLDSGECGQGRYNPCALRRRAGSMYACVSYRETILKEQIKQLQFVINIMKATFFFSSEEVEAHRLTVAFESQAKYAHSSLTCHCSPPDSNFNETLSSSLFHEYSSFPPTLISFLILHSSDIGTCFFHCLQCFLIYSVS